MIGHELLANILKGLGISHVYGLSGGAIRGTLSTCAKVGIRVIGVRHQQSTVHMSMAHNYRSGRLTSVVIVSAGPAITNTTTGILTAWDNCWPLIVIAGTFPLSNAQTLRPPIFQPLEGIRLFEPITKWATEIPATSHMADILTEAFQRSCSHRPGPVYIEIPESVLKESARVSNVPSIPSLLPITLPSTQIVRASNVLIDARRPAIILGKGLRWSAPWEEIRELAETYRIPFLTSPMGRGSMPDDHPLCFNKARDELQHQADTVIILGARLDWTFRFGKQFSRNAKIILIDIAKDVDQTTHPNLLHIQGDLKQVLRDLLANLKEKPFPEPEIQKRERWIAELAKRRHTNTLLLEEKLNQPGAPMSPHRLMKEIRDCVPRDVICVVDGRDTLAAAQEVLPCYEPASRYTPGSNGCMGVGIPFGIGAKLSSPESLVLVITGDMAFGISAMEMETAVRQNIPIIVVVVNNDGGCGAEAHHKYYPPGHERVAMYQPRLAYEKIMEAFGGFAESVTHSEEIKSALRRAIDSGLPACLNVYVDPFAPFKNYLG